MKSNIEQSTKDKMIKDMDRYLRRIKDERFINIYNTIVPKKLRSITIDIDGKYYGEK